MERFFEELLDQKYLFAEFLLRARNSENPFSPFWEIFLEPASKSEFIPPSQGNEVQLPSGSFSLSPVRVKRIPVAGSAEFQMMDIFLSHSRNF